MHVESRVKYKTGVIFPSYGCFQSNNSVVIFMIINVSVNLHLKLVLNEL